MRTEEERQKRRRKRAARELQKQNPTLKYMAALRQVIANEESKEKA